MVGCCFFNQTISGEIDLGGGPPGPPVSVPQATLDLTVFILHTVGKLATFDVEGMLIDPINGPAVIMWRLIRLAAKPWFA
jgi:hypothetical protein